jgi:hypothetical protein
MQMRKVLGRLAAILALVFLSVTVANAQSLQASTSVPLSLNTSETLSITTNSTGGVAFVPNGANYQTPSIAITTTWNLASSRTTGEICQAINLAPNLPGTTANYFENLGGNINAFNGGASPTCEALSGFGTMAPDIADLRFNGQDQFSNTETYNIVLSTQGLGTLAVGSYSGVYSIIIVVT